MFLINKKILVSFFKLIRIYYCLDLLRKFRFFKYRYHYPYINFSYRISVVDRTSPINLKKQSFHRHLDGIRVASEISATSLWEEISNNFHKEVLLYLKNKDFDQIEKMVADPLSNDLQYGFNNLSQSLQSKFRLETIHEYALTADHFYALAEYVSVVKYQNPEGLVLPFKTKKNIDTVIDDTIHKIFKTKISFPNPFKNESGLVTNYGIASPRVPAAIYQALLVTKLGNNICEIGPGLGRTAYFASLLGAKKYTLVDIPIPSICQCYFLMHSLPKTKFSTTGDGGLNKGIQLRLPNEFLTDTCKFDVILNCDSITEMGTEMARKYLLKIVDSAKYFMSINHEGNEFSLQELTLEFPEIKLISRSRSWIRPGYVEELFEIKKS